MNPLPIVLLVDDSCPLVHVYRHHWADIHGHAPLTRDGRPLRDTVPNDFLDHFCDVVQRHGIAGKFSIVPAPAGMGDVVQGIRGFDPGLTRQWLDTARERLGARFDFSPEGLTHNFAIDLQDGHQLTEGEADWSQSQNRESLTAYLARGLELLKDAGIDATGFTSCWVFGQKVEAEYLVAMAAAQQAVCGRSFAWYFLHIWHRYPQTLPYIAYARDGVTLVSINSTVDDFFWETIDSPRTDAAYVSGIADRLLTEDGRGGAIRRVIDAGGWPILMTHWQSFFSNGTESGLSVLDEVGRRVSTTLAGEVAWKSCLEVAQLTASGWRAPA